LSDTELLERVADRDPEAFRELMERFAGPVTNVAARFLDNRADAEEIAQEVFLRLYQHPPHLTPSAKLFTWLYRVTVNLCLDSLRRRRRTPETLSLQWPAGSEEEGEPLGAKIPQQGVSTPREKLAASELALAVRRIVASLPAPLRAPLVLSTVEELSHAEIAEILQISSKAVEHRLARARSLLKSRLTPYL